MTNNSILLMISAPNYLNYYKMKLQQMQDPQLQKLIQEQVQQILNDSKKQSSFEDRYMSHSNVYFDKQLTHLVVSEEFNFEKISQILSQAFQGIKIDTSEKACRMRWTYIHKNRSNMKELKQMQKQQKRARSVAAFSNPYSLYSVDQLIQNLQKTQKEKVQNNQVVPKPMEPNHTGYNIFKDSFRRIDNYEQYNSLESKMKEALKRAQQDVYEQKPLYFTPKYDNLEQFEVQGQQLTAQKARQLQTYQIQMEKIGRQLQMKRQEQEQKKYESIIKKRVEREVMSKNEKGDIDQNWDQYQSD